MRGAVPGAALVNLGKLQEFAEPYIPQMVEYLADADPSIRESVLVGLANLKKHAAPVVLCLERALVRGEEAGAGRCRREE